MTTVFKEVQFSKALFENVVPDWVTLKVIVSSFEHPLKQLTPKVFFVPLKVIDVSFVQPLKQDSPNLFPAAVLNETEGKLVHPLKQVLPNEAVALLRFRAVNPVQALKMLESPIDVKALFVVISVMPLHLKKHSLPIDFSDGSSEKFKWDVPGSGVEPRVSPLSTEILLRLLQSIKAHCPSVVKLTGNSKV